MILDKGAAEKRFRLWFLSGYSGRLDRQFPKINPTQQTFYK